MVRLYEWHDEASFLEETLSLQIDDTDYPETLCWSTDGVELLVVSPSGDERSLSIGDKGGAGSRNWLSPSTTSADGRWCLDIGSRDVRVIPRD